MAMHATPSDVSATGCRDVFSTCVCRTSCFGGEEENTDIYQFFFVALLRLLPVPPHVIFLFDKKKKKEKEYLADIFPLC